MKTPTQTTSTQEHCMNPYLDENNPCHNTDIKAILQINPNEKLPLCFKCYDYIIDHDVGVTPEQIPTPEN